MTPDVLATLQQHLLQCLAAPPSEVRRLLHGRGRCWPGLEQLTVDWLQGTLLVCLYRDPGAAALAALQDSLHALTRQPQWASSGAERLLLQLRYLADSPALWLHGTPVQQCQVSEQGLHYLLDLGSKQNNGLFLDMRLGRQWVREQAAGRRVLNLFAYTCGFSVAALAGGAQQVVNLDMARAALSGIPVVGRAFKVGRAVPSLRQAVSAEPVQHGLRLTNPVMGATFKAGAAENVTQMGEAAYEQALFGTRRRNENAR